MKIIDQQVRSWTRTKAGTCVFRVFAEVINGDRTIEQCREEIEEGRVVE